MSDARADAPPVVIALAVGDPMLADRLAALLANTPGIRLAASGEATDATIVTPAADGRDLD